MSTPHPIQLVVGLGNPGRRYADTRHNVGQWLLDALARSHSLNFKLENKFHGQVARLSQPHPCWLLQPTTYMNDSGRAIHALAQFYKIQPQNILVVHDELDPPPGCARLKTGGGHGGHNGLRDLIAHLGGKQNFHRLRLGIGHPGHKDQVADYVLTRPSRHEQQQIDGAIDTALSVMTAVIKGDMAGAMRDLHTLK